MPYAMKISHQDFHVSKTLPRPGHDFSALLHSPLPRLGSSPSSGQVWEETSVHALGTGSWGWRCMAATQGPCCSSWQGNVLLAAESEFEQTQWLEMLQESGKV